MLPVITDTHLKKQNLSENIEVFSNALTWCLENNHKALYHMGDVFDSRKTQSELMLTTFANILDMFDSAKVTLVVIPGNHDKTDYTSTSSFLHPFQHHPALVLVEDYYQFDIDSEVRLHFIPFFANDQYNERLEQVEEKLGSGTNILLTHIGVSGAVMNNGIKVEGIALSSFKHFDKVLVGHYHDKQQLQKGKIEYVGAALQHNFGETTEGKGLVELHNDFTTTIHPLDTKVYETIEIDVDKLTIEYIEEIKSLKQEGKDEIRVVLIGSEEKIKSFNKMDLEREGIAVQLKPTKIEREVIQERVEPFNEQTLYEEFDIFCEKNKLDKEKGKQYLDKALKVA